MNNVSRLRRRSTRRALVAVVAAALLAPLAAADPAGAGPAIDTWVVSHGTQIPIRNIRVGGGN